MPPTVSVIVPCYNQAQYLSESLESVLHQSYSCWECIIVNDGSRDNVKEVVSLFSGKDKRFKYIEIDNRGVSAARNVGIANSTGKYILPLDADDKIGKDYIEDAVTVLDKNSQVKLVYCKAEMFGNKVGHWDLPEYNYHTILMFNMIFCSSLFRRVDYDKTGGYNTNMIYGWEDWDFWLALLDVHDQVFCIPKVYFYYRIRSNTRSQVVNKSRSTEMRNQIVCNHVEKYVAAFGNPIDNRVYINDLKNQINYLESEVERLNTNLVSFANSLSFKSGRAITAPLRLLRSLIKMQW